MLFIRERGAEGAPHGSHPTVTVTLPRGGETMKRAGHTLTIFRKVGGRWLLARDANLLVKV